jgi:hypothetical protein
MKVHRETVDVLIALYDKSQRILAEENGTSMNDDEALEAAAMDYIMSDEHARFRSLVDNLDGEVCRELVALMQMGREPGTYSAADFIRLKSDAQTGLEAGDYLFGQKQLPTYWRTAIDMLASG